MNGRGSRTSVILCAVQWLLYAAFVFLWFKDNIFSLRSIHISYIYPLALFAAVLAIRIVSVVKKKKPVLRLKLGREILVCVVLLLLAAAVRWPFLRCGSGMMTSDDSVPALMGKHIAEGKLAPICFYGQQYLGSLGSHIHALFFRLFGYSIFSLKFSTLVLYLAFVALQFRLLREAFPLASATAISLFYVLPTGQLVHVGLENTSAYGLVLLLGAAIIYLTYLVALKDKKLLIPPLGFVMGLAFWTHQITASFILTALLILIFRAKLRPGRYAILAFYGLLGGLPLVFQEIFNRFELVRFLFGGERSPLGREKLAAAGEHLRSLLAPGSPWLGFVLLSFVALGIVALAYASLKSRGRAPESIFLLSALVFAAVYMFSRFGDKLLARYLFPAYFCLPVLLIAPFTLIRGRIKHVLSFGLIGLVLIADGWPVYSSYLRSVKNRHLFLTRVVTAMRNTGVRYWQADYWTAYLLTAASGERPIVDSYGTNRYLPYRLDYFNRDGDEKDSYVFLGGPDTSDYACALNLNHLLTTLGIPFRKQNFGECSLVYDIESPVLPSVLYEDAPAHIPRLGLDRALRSQGSLRLDFRPAENHDFSKFRLNVEIPGYSAAAGMLSRDSRETTISIAAPQRERFPVRYWVDFRSLKIPSTSGEFSFSGGKDDLVPRADPVIYLRGIGSRISRLGREVRLCEKEAAFEIPSDESERAKLRLVLVSPFNFADLKWYGRYTQQVSIRLNGGPPVEKTLLDGPNVVELGLAGASRAGSPIRVEMKFRYRFLFDFANLKPISTLLEKIEVFK